MNLCSQAITFIMDKQYQHASIYCISDGIGGYYNNGILLISDNTEISGVHFRPFICRNSYKDYFAIIKIVQIFY